jgi:hypothetical protein
MPKSRAQFTPMRTTAADSRTKIVITLDTQCRPNPLFENRLLVEQRIGPRTMILTFVSIWQLSRRWNLSSAREPQAYCASLCLGGF